MSQRGPEHVWSLLSDPKPEKMALDFSSQTEKNLPGRQITSLLCPKPAQPWVAPTCLWALLPSPHVSSTSLLIPNHPAGNLLALYRVGVKGRYGESRGCLLRDAKPSLSTLLPSFS